MRNKYPLHRDENEGFQFFQKNQWDGVVVREAWVFEENYPNEHVKL